MKTKREALETKLYAVTSALYQQQAPQPEAGGQPHNNDGPVDAEYRDVDNN